MIRRDAIRLIPFSCAAAAGIVAGGVEGRTNDNKATMDGGPLSMRYIRRVLDMLRWIRDTQSGNMLEASYAVARTVKNGGTVWTNWDMGHNNSYDLFPERNGVPAYITMGYDQKRTKSGDLFMTSRAGGPEKDIVEKDIFVVGCPCPWGGDAKGQEFLSEDVQKEKIRPYSKIWVETNITTHGAIMRLPGRPAPFGPVSGVLGLVTFWMIQADACRVLGRDGVQMKVSGDEPVLSGDRVPRIDLDEPILDHYFETTTSQIGMIESELGVLREIARMAVDSVLGGGKVYCYSRYRNSLAVEGHHRRGGLALTRGVCMNEGRLTSMDGYVPFEGTPNDCVIMGLWEPDDEVDLASLDAFRKAGMKVASMGTATRGGAVPKGRTVPKESDVHAGWMCDTYGLYAVPGFERRVCPTSGPVINQLWWAACMEIAEEIIQRTGIAPGVFLSAAIEGGREYNNIMMQQYYDLGY